MGKVIVKSPDEVVQYVLSRKNLSVEDFYNFVTFNGTQFNYDINSTGGRAGYTALHAACHHGNVPLVRALLSMGALPNITSKGGNDYPLNIAFEKSDFELVKVLVEYGARFDVYRDRFGTVRHDISNCRTKEVRERIQALADAGQNQVLPRALEKNQEYYDILRQLEAMVESSDVAGARKLFVEYFINIRDVMLISTSLMKVAIKNNCLDMVRLLAEQGDDLIEANVLYMSDLMRGISDAINRSTDENCSSDECDEDKDNAAHSNPELARLLGYDEIAKFLEETQRSRYQKLKAAIQLEVPQKREAITLSGANLFAANKVCPAENPSVSAESAFTLK